MIKDKTFVSNFEVVIPFTFGPVYFVLFERRCPVSPYPVSYNSAAGVYGCFEVLPVFLFESPPVRESCHVQLFNGAVVCRACGSAILGSLKRSEEGTPPGGGDSPVVNIKCGKLP